MVHNIRLQFPIFHKDQNQNLIYFDNAATTQKPKSVIDSMTNFYESYNANIHRGMYPIAESATLSYENARRKIARFIHARTPREIIFTSGTTEGINLVAQTWGRKNLKNGDKVVLSIAEHHSNIVPWLQLKEEIGIEIVYIPILDGVLDLEKAKEILSLKKVKLLSIQHVSNTLGIKNSIEELLTECSLLGITTLIDSAQSIAHCEIDVEKLGCDFLVFSGHKMYGPTGTGVLYGKEKLLESIPAWKGGGSMIHEVFKDRFTTNELPYKFEAGTPNIAGIIGLGYAVDFILENFPFIKKQEEELGGYLYDSLSKLDFVEIYTSKYNSKTHVPIIAFNIKNIHSHDVADILGQNGIAVRAGHHCTQPLHTSLGINSTLRASLAFYNTKEEIDKFIEVLKSIYKKFN